MRYRSFVDEKRLEHAIKELQLGKQDSLSIVYRILYRQLFTYTFAITKRQDTTEDILQEVFLKIYQHCLKYQNGTNARAWIYQICHNTSISYIKKHSTEITLEGETLTYFIDQTYQTATTDFTFVEETLSALNEIEKQIVTLFLYGGLKHKEISVVLEIPYDKVRSTYSYALTKMRNHIKKGEKI